MRTAGKIKAGHYPLPLPEAQRIRRSLEFPSATTVALDPCVGEGTAFAMIAAVPEVMRYGIELDAYRAQKAQTVCADVIQGDAMETTCPAESLALLYENPPYDWELGDSGNRRMEPIFLSLAEAGWRSRLCGSSAASRRLQTRPGYFTSETSLSSD